MPREGTDPGYCIQVIGDVEHIRLLDPARFRGNNVSIGARDSPAPSPLPSLSLSLSLRLKSGVVSRELVPGAEGECGALGSRQGQETATGAKLKGRPQNLETISLESWMRSRPFAWKNGLEQIAAVKMQAFAHNYHVREPGCQARASLC